MNDDGMKDEKSGFAFGMSSRWGSQNKIIIKKKSVCRTIVALYYMTRGDVDLSSTRNEKYEK